MEAIEQLQIIEESKDRAIGEFERESAKLEELEPARKLAEAALKRLDKFFPDEVVPFIVKVQRAGVKDGEIDSWLSELIKLAQVPNRIREGLQASRECTFSEFSHPTFTNIVDVGRRDALIAHYARLLRPGDIERDARRLMAQIDEQAKALIEKNQPAGGIPAADATPSVAIVIKTKDEGRPLSSNLHFDARRQIGK